MTRRWRSLSDITHLRKCESFIPGIDYNPDDLVRPGTAPELETLHDNSNAVNPANVPLPQSDDADLEFESDVDGSETSEDSDSGYFSDSSTSSSSSDDSNMDHDGLDSGYSSNTSLSNTDGDESWDSESDEEDDDDDYDDDDDNDADDEDETSYHENGSTIQPCCAYDTLLKQAISDRQSTQVQFIAERNILREKYLTGYLADENYQLPPSESEREMQLRKITAGIYWLRDQKMKFEELDVIDMDYCRYMMDEVRYLMTPGPHNDPEAEWIRYGWRNLSTEQEFTGQCYHCRLPVVADGLCPCCNRQRSLVEATFGKGQCTEEMYRAEQYAQECEHRWPPELGYSFFLEYQASH